MSFICVMVDPYGFFRIAERTGVNQQKEGVRDKIRYVKALEVALRQPRTLLLGSSRVHDGMNPESKQLRSFQPVYNYGINMLRINEANKYLDHALKNTKVERVIFGLDFFMFNALEKYNPSFDSTLVGRKINFTDFIAPALPSKYTITDAYATIKVSSNNRSRREFLANGYRPGASVFYQLADYKKLHYFTNWTFLSSDKYRSPYYGRYKADEQTFSALDRFLRTCREHRIECILFITPAHALLDGEGIRLTGLWNTMEDFKRKTAVIAARYDTPLWDFSGYNEVTTETVKTPMKYYWDSSHFTEYVSEQILGKITGHRGELGDDFGTRLTPSNVEAHLARIREDRERYAATHPADIKEIEAMFKRIKAGLPIPSEMTTGIFKTP